MAAVRDKKSSAYKTLTKLKPRSNPSISVGIHAAEGSSQHEDDGLSIAELAEMHEFGLGVPGRPFIRQWFDEGKQDHNKLIEKELERAVMDGKFEQHLTRAALGLEASCKQYISDGTHVTPNAPSTEAQKGSSVPLIDTGVLRASIAGKVEFG